MAMVNMNNLLNGKDSRWLQLEVCREFQRNKCSRPDTECKFAHPPANVEVQNGRVTACYDSIKGRCNREKPPCKYFHPPQHLKDQLLINGRNHLALKNALMQQMGLTPGQPLVPGQVQAVAANPYLTGMPQVGGTYSPYFAPAGPIMPTIMGAPGDPTAGVGSPLGVVAPQTVVAQQKMPRSDRLEMDMKSVGSFYYENFAFPAGMVPYKRPAADKSGVPVYQPNATTYQQLMQLQQPFVPVSCEYPSSPGTPNANAASVTTMANTAAPPPPQHPPPSASASPPLQQPAPPLTPKEEPQQQQQQQQYQQQLQQVPPPPPPSHSAPPPMLPDPAALAKEVAQQNYAKAIKLAAMNQQLNPLNYTGVSLNKQMVAAAAQPSPAAYPRYPATLPFQFQAGGLSPLGLANPYQAALAQQNLLNLRSQAQPNFQINPYSLIRPQYMTAAAAAPAQYQLLQQQAQYPVAVSAAPMTTATPSGSIAVAAAQNNNNNVVLQPYKKLKTT